MPTTRSMPLESTKKGTASERATSPKEQKSSSTAIVIRDPTAAGKTDTEVAQTFKADLQSLRTLVTCTICDQLLYEPWTLACGHTYCYSCLSSWFLVDKRKKTCPECRKAVKELPAPSFLVKQMVEIFIHRTELMPVDETTEQHRLRKEEENQIVEADRASNEGLFKGAFTSDKISKIYWDEEDGVERCRACSHEWTGGQSCDNCGVEFDNTEDMDRDFSETDLDEVDHIELDLDAELGDDFDADAYHAGFWRDALMDEEAEVDDYAFHPRVPRFLFPGAINPRTRRAPVIIDTDEDEEDSEDDDEGSLADFVVNDNTPHRHQRGSRRQVISLIDDEDEEEEEEEDDDDEDSDTIYDGRRRRRVPHVPRAPSVVTVDSTSGESADERRIRGQGWSPLDYGQESDYSEGRQLMPTYDTEESDTSTIGGNQHSDEEDEEDEDVDEDDRESTPQFRSAGGHLRDLLAGRTRQRRRHVSVSTTSVEDGEADDDDSGDETSGLDRDGDIEMSVSPTASSHSSNNEPRRAWRRGIV